MRIAVIKLEEISFFAADFFKKMECRPFWSGIHCIKKIKNLFEIVFFIRPVKQNICLHCLHLSKSSLFLHQETSYFLPNTFILLLHIYNDGFDVFDAF